MPAFKLIVTGIVQGVGFRPFIHRLALETGVTGYVRNVGGAEVEVFIEGTGTSIGEFIKGLYTKTPPPAIIDEIEVFEENPIGYKEFKILKSGRNTLKKSMIPPDFAICDYCLKEILDENNRRFRYPFNSCAWCGPRFSMMYTVPYDRENTSMRKYRLCNDCFAEYTNVHDIRRYHAQGISCPRDGPRLWLMDNKGERIDTKDPIRDAAKLIEEGFIIAVKGLGGYHLAALASCDDVVEKLRKRKNRPRKPFAVMVLDTIIAEKLVYLDDKAKRILTSPQRPIVLLPKKPESPVSKLVSPGMFYEGIFTPYTGLHYLLLMETKDKFLIMTSGNMKGKPMCIDEDCAFKKLSSIADYFLIHDREIVNRVDDSVLRFTDGEPVLLRRSRGYAPLWIKLPRRLEKNVIAFGADLQMTAGIGFSDKAVLTQYIGDLDDEDTLRDLLKYLKFFIDNYRINLKDSIIVVDKHPLYNSRKLGLEFSKKYNLEIIEVQHHYAHVLATAIDRGIEGEFIGIALDGTGYGDDGAIWGGEILLVNTYKGTYTRVGHLAYQPLDSERSIYYPLRFFVSVLSRVLDWNEIEKIISFYSLEKLVPRGLKELRMLYTVINRGLYTKTSSTGRFLDGISAFLNIAPYRSYEGEPAITLESHGMYGKYLGMDHFLPKISITEGQYVINTTSVYLELVEKRNSFNTHDIAYTIQYNLGKTLGEVVIKNIKGRRGIQNSIVLGGGATVNTIIVKGIKDVLANEGMKIVLPRKIPCNDGGIALGQIAAILYSKSQ
ncbi:carbamoyltransferase HypF [Desulfurococcaceae archaeon MEX13E-LK6-19]|nr:carbamoyltransferase HypF [Desulfurococcaceae archaeon MEX13E-LK6-19]